MRAEVARLTEQSQHPASCPCLCQSVLKCSRCSAAVSNPGRVNPMPQAIQVAPLWFHRESLPPSIGTWGAELAVVAACLHGWHAWVASRLLGDAAAARPRKIAAEPVLHARWLRTCCPGPQLRRARKSGRGWRSPRQRSNSPLPAGTPSPPRPSRYPSRIASVRCTMKRTGRGALCNRPGLLQRNFASKTFQRC